MFIRGIFIFILLLVPISTSWATEKPYVDIGDVEGIVTPRMGSEIKWNPESNKTPETMPDLEGMLRKKLSADDAIKIALWNNNSLKASLQELGISRADLIQAGLPENPEVSAGFLIPVSGGAKLLPHVTATQNILDLFLLSLRKKVAASQIEETKLEVADTALDLIMKVRSAYYTLQAAQQFRSFLRTIAQTTKTAAELSERQFSAGNINKLELDGQKVLTQQAQIELTRAETETHVAQEQLSELLGLQGYSGKWEIEQKLPNFPKNERSLEELEKLALSNRLDLAAARQRASSLDAGLKLAKTDRIPRIKFGVESEKDSDSPTRVGPELGLTLPFFDRGQAKQTHIKAQMLKNRYGIAALENQALTEVRSSRARLLQAREIAGRYRQQLIPLLKDSIDEAQLHYNFMLVGVYQLLQARREEVNAQRQYLEALRDYWIERANLERAIGTRLDTPLMSSKEESSLGGK